MITPERALQAQVSHMKKWPRCPRSPLLLLCLLSPGLVGIPPDQLAEEEKSGPDSQTVLHNMQTPPPSGQLQHYSPPWDISKGQW